MNVAEFIDKWRRVELTERSAAQQHFLDLCDLLDHPPSPKGDPMDQAEVDRVGEFFTFERGATKKDGSDGWADVWKKDYFAWEYKGRHKDLQAAYLQLDQYRAALENPPLLVTCDMGRLVVHTNFTATKQQVHDIPLDELGEPRNLEILRAIFHAPQKLKPGTTSEAITADAARRVAELAVALRERGLDPHDVAHFLDRVVFSYFAEDVGLLPGMVVTRLLEQSRAKPASFPARVRGLFQAMKEGGYFGVDEIRRFNGNLFETGPILDLTAAEIEHLYEAARLDWSAVDPSIFGTLFERGMDPGKRSQLGAHYTSREDIETPIWVNRAGGDEAPPPRVARGPAARREPPRHREEAPQGRGPREAAAHRSQAQAGPRRGPDLPPPLPPGPRAGPRPRPRLRLRKLVAWKWMEGRATEAILC
jgi:hypothetical protein